MQIIFSRLVQPKWLHLASFFIKSSTFDVVLLKQAEETAHTFKESFGLSEQSAKDLLSSTGDLLVGFGFTEESALGLSTQVNQLAVDLASFTNFSGGAKG